LSQIIVQEPMLGPKDDGTRILVSGDPKGFPEGNEVRDVLKKLREKLGFESKPLPQGLLQFKVVDGEKLEHYRFPRAYYTLFEWMAPEKAKAMNARHEFKLAGNSGLRHIINFAWRYA
jgi:hypothetical protein